MKVIILAAGQGFQLDGFNKILLKNPKTKKTILDQYLKIFKGCDVTVVVGYKAITIMNEYPELNYIYNSEWRTRGNAYSLSLAIDETPCIILPSDLFLSRETGDKVMNSKGDVALVAYNENRTPVSLHCCLSDNKIIDTYRGKFDQNDPEIMGIFKIESIELLRRWRKNCATSNESSAFSCKNLPYTDFDVTAIDKGTDKLFEVNTPNDYISFIESTRDKNND